MSAMAPLRTLGRIRSTSFPPCKMSWLSLCSTSVDIFCCGINYSWCNFTCLINNVSTRICEIISTKETTKLSFSPTLSSSPSFFVYSFSLSPAHSEILSFLVQLQENQETCFFLTTILSSKDLFNNSIDKLQRLLSTHPRWI